MQTTRMTWLLANVTKGEIIVPGVAGVMNTHRNKAQIRRNRWKREELEGRELLLRPNQ